MVHALERAAALLAPGGTIVDLHPTPEPAHLDVTIGSDMTRIADRVDDGSPTAPTRRHAAADAALAACERSGVLIVRATIEFTFHTLADDVDELLRYVATKWKQLHFAEADLRRARERLGGSAGATVAITERVRATRMDAGR